MSTLAFISILCPLLVLTSNFRKADFLTECEGMGSNVVEAALVTSATASAFVVIGPYLTTLLSVRYLLKAVRLTATYHASTTRIHGLMIGLRAYQADFIGRARSIVFQLTVLYSVRYTNDMFQRKDRLVHLILRVRSRR